MAIKSMLEIGRGPATVPEQSSIRSSDQTRPTNTQSNLNFQPCNAIN